MITKLIKTNRGVSLVEVMVTIFVLSIGLLGIAALQIQSKRANIAAIERTAASMLAYEIIERMRANTDQLEEYLDEVAATGVGNNYRSEPDQECTASEPCTPFQLVLHDLYEWEQAIMGTAETASGKDTGGLTSPTGCITGPGTGGTGVYTISIAWRGRTAISDPTLNSCGQGSGKYNGEEGTDVYRRLLTVSVFINATI